MLLTCVALSGCLAINKTLGNKIDLKDKRVASLGVAATGDSALCPGHEMQLIATATLDGGERVQTEGLAEASGILSLDDDIANPWAPISIAS